MKVACIVVAAGRSRRLRSSLRKPYVKLGKLPILAHTLKFLNKDSQIDTIVLVVAADDLNRARSFIVKYGFGKVKRVVGGGKTRFASVRNGLKKIDEDTGIVLIHDGVRPFLERSFVHGVIKAAKKFGGAVCAVPVKPTVKKVTKDAVIKETPDRKYLWEAQTPQGFRKNVILRAYAKALDIKATDDASVVERIGGRVKIVKGSYRNIKITTPEDLEIARALLK